MTGVGHPGWSVKPWTPLFLKELSVLGILRAVVTNFQTDQRRFGYLSNLCSSTHRPPGHMALLWKSFTMAQPDLRQSATTFRPPFPPIKNPRPRYRITSGDPPSWAWMFGQIKRYVLNNNMTIRQRISLIAQASPTLPICVSR